MASATRAAELSNWKNSFVLSTLTAAHAEAGSFAAAVHWEEAAQKPYNAVGQAAPNGQERLSLYKAGKPYRMRP